MCVTNLSFHKKYLMKKKIVQCSATTTTTTYPNQSLRKYGGPENLLLVEDVIPEPRANEVRVKVLTAGVSFADILMREGVHPESGNLEEHHLLQDGMLLALLIN